MAKDKIQTYLPAWRQAEDRFYGSVMNAPELYTEGIHLVRAIADSLKHVEDTAALAEAYPQTDIRRVADIADGMELLLRDFLDYNLARDAAFYLRYREILEAKAQAEVLAQLAAARSRGDRWVTLYHNETPRQGFTFFQRLEMHVADGIGIYSAIELDWEKGRVYVVEPVALDPDTGLLQKGASAPDPRLEFATREEMIVAIAVLRKKYSAGHSTSNHDEA